jgi:hypothetical protein
MALWPCLARVLWLHGAEFGLAGRGARAERIWQRFFARLHLIFRSVFTGFVMAPQYSKFSAPFCEVGERAEEKRRRACCGLCLGGWPRQACCGLR